MTSDRTEAREPPTLPGGTSTPDKHATFPIVGVGASAGGLVAYTELLLNLPLDTGMAFVLVQHLDPEHESALTDILARATALPVQEATNELEVEANRVYVIPPNTTLSIERGTLKLETRKPARTPHHSIDLFFESLAQDAHERAIGVVLSGTASDGTLGLEAIKAEGGITFAQDDSARYDAMPRSAVAAGCVDLVLSPADIARELGRIARHPYVAGQSIELLIPAGSEPATGAPVDEAPPPAREKSHRPGKPAAGAVPPVHGESPADAKATDSYRTVLSHLRNYSRVDFSLYKSATLQRRIARRMVLSRRDTLEDYASFLRGNTAELEALYADVLINVTTFFRNQDAFEVLEHKVFPALLKQRGDDPLRVWALGCSTGQEAYSIAMTFMEAADKAEHARPMQIFATDLNDVLLHKARQGLYAKGVTKDVSPERLRRFFVEEQGGYRVIKPLREMVIFARQNLITDPPFSRMDLVSCRNLLIYLETGLQRRLLPSFHYALKPRGYLFLGASESVGGFSDLFEPADKKHRIYIRRAGPTTAIRLPVPAKVRGGEDRDAASVATAPPLPENPVRLLRAELDAQREADRISVRQFSPPGVLVDDALRILQFRGATGAYLMPPSGKASFNVLKMAREGLASPLRAAINQARKDNKAVRKNQVRIAQDGWGARTAAVEVIPLRNLRDRCFLILFEDEGANAPRAEVALPPAGATADAKRSVSAKAASRRVGELEADLAETRDYLQSMQEQHEAANEELQAANEEVQSANEELQSINEELETSKEELESANEELTTLNEEMAHRNLELNRLNNDLINLQTSAGLAIVLLGRDLTIRRFSAEAEAQFHLQASDIGRPIGHLRHGLVLAGSGDANETHGPLESSPPDLERFIADVIVRVHERSREVRNQDGRWFSLRVRPYLTLDNKVDGAVLVLVDIDADKRNEQAVASARDYAEAIVRTVRDPLLVLDASLRVRTANNAFYNTFKIARADAEGRPIGELGNGQWNIPRLRESLDDMLARNGSFDDLEITHDFATLGRRTLLFNARMLREAGEGIGGVLMGVLDVTERRQLQIVARQTQVRYRALVEASAQIVWSTDVAGAVVEDSPSWRAFTGQTFEQRMGFGWLDALHPADRERIREQWLRGVVKAAPIEMEYRLRHISGDWRWMVARAVPVRNANGSVREWIGMNIDISGRKQAEEALKETDRRKDEFLAVLAHELRGPLAPLVNATEILKLAGDDPERKTFAVNIMERQLGQMNRLIDDLLDVNRISHGKLDLRRTPVDLADVLRPAVEALRASTTSDEPTLTVTLPTKPIYVDADPARLVQVFGNLLSNAVKYSEERASIALTATARGGEAIVSVRDAGIGIAKDVLPHVFEMFTQGDYTSARSRGGLGIGLALVRQLVEMHGGSVEALSDGPGRGSEFVVRLPMLNAARAWNRARRVRAS